MEDAAGWVVEELQTLNFGDQRLNTRLGSLLTTLSDQPQKSIPKACKGWAETLAAYRFFSNKAVTMQKILSPHMEATIKRIKDEKIVLMPQDTTELNFSHREEVQGMGELSRDFEQGFHLHPTIALTPSGTCLGIINSEAWIRETLGEKAKRNKKPIEEKESMRWLNSYRICNEVAKQAQDTLIVNIADREGDIYDLFMEKDNLSKAHWLVRSSQNRRLLSTANETLTEKLHQKARKLPIVGQIKFNLSARGKRKERIVDQEVRSGRLRLKPPSPLGGKPIVEVNVVFCREKNTTPQGEKPIEWLLLTSVPIETSERALEIVSWYLCRWQIEIFFKLLKTGCKIESLQLETYERILNCLALYMIIAWRAFHLTMLGREHPDANCELVFEKQEWRVIYAAVTRKAPPKKSPTLYQMIRMIGNLGGFLGRKSDGEPGAQAIWIGLQRMKDFILINSLAKELQ